jgi:hypothetical protein
MLAEKNAMMNLPYIIDGDKVQPYFLLRVQG